MVFKKSLFSNTFHKRSPSTSPDARFFRRSPTNAYSILVGNSRGNCVPPASRNQILIDGAIRSLKKDKKDINPKSSISSSAMTDFQSPEDTAIKEDIFSRLSPRWKNRTLSSPVIEKRTNSQQ